MDTIMATKVIALTLLFSFPFVLPTLRMARRSGNGLLLFTNKCAMLSLVVNLCTLVSKRVKERTHDLNLLEFCLPSQRPTNASVLG